MSANISQQPCDQMNLTTSLQIWQLMPPICDFQSVDCRLCSGRSHIKCADLNKNQDCIDWYCAKCLESIFPFNNIENDQEFMNTIYCYGNLSIKSSMIESLNKIVYNPFAYERKRAILNNRDI